jgi:hypothetical protein
LRGDARIAVTVTRVPRRILPAPREAREPRWLIDATQNLHRCCGHGAQRFLVLAGPKVALENDCKLCGESLSRHGK